MKANKNWYVIYTKQNSEKRVADLLKRKKITNYCPICYNSIKLNGKTKNSNVTLFSNMIFVYVTEEDLTLIKNIDGVSGIMYWLQKPATVSNNEIDSIKHFLEINKCVQLEKINVRLDSEINSENTPSFSKTSSNTFEADYLKKVCLPSLGYALITSSTSSVTQLKNVA